MSLPPPLSLSGARFDAGRPSAARAGRTIVPTRLASGLRVEALHFSDAERHRAAWLDLQGRALEPNAFLDPDFAVAAARHLGAAERPTFLFVWADGPGPSSALLGVCPVTRRRGLSGALLHGWTHRLAALGTPLIDAARGAEALEGLLTWAGGAGGGACLLFGTLPADGPVSRLIAEVARRRGLRTLAVDSWARAALRSGPGRDRSGLGALSAKGAKEARRQRRRLADLGHLRFVSARAELDLADAVEQFLALEARGWKGLAGTAMLMRPGETAFTRTMSRLLRRRGRCRIDALTLDGVPVAMGVTLSDGDVDYLWKIAYDPQLARFSPGVQFVLDFTERQREEGRAALTDSCAIPRHPMIDRLWRDRLRMADIAVETRPGWGFALTLARLRAAKAIRAAAKRAVSRLPRGPSARAAGAA